MAHIALAHHATIFVVLRHAVGTIPGAILAANASISRVQDYAGCRVFRIRFNRATRHARWFQAMIAAHGHVPALRFRIDAAFNFADSTPVQMGRISVLFITCHHATLTADAGTHVEVEPVLFPRIGCTGGHQLGRVFHQQGKLMVMRILKQREFNGQSAPPVLQPRLKKVATAAGPLHPLQKRLARRRPLRHGILRPAWKLQHVPDLWNHVQ